MHVFTSRPPFLVFGCGMDALAALLWFTSPTTCRYHPSAFSNRAAWVQSSDSLERFFSSDKSFLPHWTEILRRELVS